VHILLGVLHQNLSIAELPRPAFEACLTLLVFDPGSLGATARIVMNLDEFISRE